MLRKILTALLICYSALVLPASALADTSYSFGVPRELVDVSWNANGSESLEYTINFTNQAGAHPIDFVDMGMPNSNFDMGTVTADVNGTRVDVSQSDYQGSGSGFSVVMGSQTIQPGASGSVHVFVGSITGVLYPDSSDNTYASADFAPSYFGSQYVVGTTDLSVTYHLPPGVKPNEPRWHEAPSGFPSEPQTGIDSQNRVTYTWESQTANAYTSYAFGASFPKSYVPDSAIVQTSIFDSLGTLISDLFSTFSGAVPFCCFGFFFIVLPIISAIQGQRRKLQYIPPRIGIEGHGIKRGLTAVEAAILLEQPLDKVMMMILFGVVKKGAAEVVSRDPLELAFASTQPANLNQYETDFLKAFGQKDLTLRRRALQDMTVALVKSVGEKMKGFSRKETQDYYKNIMEQAWKQVEDAQTPEVKGQAIDQNLEWTMLDHDYDERSRRLYTGPVFLPMWWGRYDPMYRTTTPYTGTATTPASMSIPSGGRSLSSLPGADFAASVVGGVQTMSNKVIGNLNSFTSGVTNVTNPPPPPSSGGGYHGGGGCACACACAGCACACAGGGR